LVKLGYVLVVVVMALISTASAISVGVSSNTGSSNIEPNAGDEDPFSINTVLAPDLFQNHISGSGSFNESHWVKNDAGGQAGVGVNITDAKSYTYSYALEKGETGKIKAQETLDVDTAVMIKAYSEARVSIGSKARSEINIGHGSLVGYSNEAFVSADGSNLGSNQKFSKAEGTFVQAESQGSIGDAKSRTITDMMNFGTLTDYSDTANGNISKKTINVKQLGHIEIDPLKGDFTSSSYFKTPSDKKETNRTSNYGNKYDFEMTSSSKESSGWFGPNYDGTTKGRLRYYVEKFAPFADRIQSAIDASSKGDYISIAPGTYRENLVVKKSLNLEGSGPDKTIIDGQRTGSVIKVKDSDARMYIKGLALTNGSAENGGGVDTLGDLTLDNFRIFSNRAEYGGGVYSKGKLAIKNGRIEDNIAKYGGGIYNQRSSASLKGGRISNNKADYGGAIYNNHGTLYLEAGDISRNTANIGGGGIYNDWTFYKGAFMETNLYFTTTRMVI
jgi:hypothetical protein